MIIVLVRFAAEFFFLIVFEVWRYVCVSIISLDVLIDIKAVYDLLYKVSMGEEFICH